MADKELKPCPFCRGSVYIYIRSFGDHKDPDGQGSQMTGYIDCSTKYCIAEVFKLNRYYEDGYKYNSDRHVELKSELRDAISIKWNARTPDTELVEFARVIIKEVCWSCNQADALDIQDLAEKLNLIVPHTATEDDVDDESDFDVGDRIYQFSEILKEQE